jgi:transcriptional regulator with XRE-family HTH domain
MTPKEIREALGLSQDFIAERLKLTQRQVRYKEQKGCDIYREFLYDCYRDILEGSKDYPESAIKAHQARQHLTDVYMQRWFESP